MRRMFLGLAVVAVACTGGQEPSPAPSTSSTTPATTSQPPGTSTTTQPSTTTSTVAPTTTATLPELEGLVYEEIARLDFPIQMVPWRTTNLLAAKDGRVWLLESGVVSEAPVLDIRDQVRNEGEQGLLGIAVEPWESADRLFVHYTANNGDTIVSEFGWGSGEFVAEKTLLRLNQPARNHNGGMLQFDRDGRLYLGLGDGGGSNDRFGHGQNRESLLGGLVAIDVDTGQHTLFQYGLRNPWRFWIDDGLIYVADVGQSEYEEVDVAPLEADINYGWPIMEGLHCFSSSSECDTTGLTLPVIEVGHGDAGTCSITGGVVYRGSAIPEIEGHFFYSDYCGGYLRSFRYESGTAVDQTDWTDQVGVAGNVASFGVDQDGEMYVLTTERVLKVIPVR